MLYYRHFGKALKKEVFDSIMGDLIKEASSLGGKDIGTHDYFKYRISFATDKEHDLLFIFVSGLTDNPENVGKELRKCRKEFLNLYGDIINQDFDESMLEMFDPIVDSFHRNLRPKISLVGFSGVGKTTITKLIKAEEIPMQHVPTITGDIATIKIGKLHFHLWDFAGQEQFSYLWNNFVKGSDAVLIITDSTLENVEKSKFFLELIKEQAPNAHTAVIGNKQDLEEAMKPEKIEKILGLKTYSMIAKDPANRDKMIQIIADVLEMSAEVSPLLKPLLERDSLIEEAKKALENAQFEKAANLFEKISDLCLELGDDSLSKEFFEKANKIKTMLRKVETTVVETPKEPEEKKEETIEKPPELKKEKVEVEKPLKAPPPPKIESLKKVSAPSPLKKEKEEVKIEEKVEEKIEKVEKEAVKKPETKLEMSPEEFMVKDRPKVVLAVPKDAKAKLKTSPYSQVSNAPVAEELKEKPKITEEKPPAQEEEAKIKVEETKVGSPASTPERPRIDLSESLVTNQQKSDIEKTIMDLKIKQANLSKIALDLEMKELTGEISTEEMKEKKARLDKIKSDIDNQIKDLEELLK
ncbi:MAG: ADP-ribosylation factor-like protein [Promethearchaeota archaeon]